MGGQQETGAIAPKCTTAISGWWVVLTSAFALFLGPVPIMVFSFGVFMTPFSREFHSGRAAVSLAFTLHNLIFAAGLPTAGKLVDRFGARKVILPATVLAGLTQMSAMFCSGRIWQLYLFYIAMGAFECGAAALPYCSVVSRWFDRHRGLALGLMMFGMGSGGFVMPPLAQNLIARFGWRLTFGLVGAAILFFTVPVVAIFLRERPKPQVHVAADHPPAVTTAGVTYADGLSWHDAWHAPAFWLLLCAFMLVSASVHACFTHMAPILADRGSSAQAAAFASSLFGAGLMVGRTGTGYLLDRFFAPRVAAVIFGAAAFGIALLGVNRSPQLAFAGAVFVGIGLGAEGDVMAYLAGRYFGLRSFGEIYGFIYGGFVAAGGLGAWLMGAAFDTNASYAMPLASFCIAASLGTALMMALGPYRYGIAPQLKNAGQVSLLVLES